MGNILWTNCDFIFHFRCPDTFSFLGNLLSLEGTSSRDNLNSQIQIFCCYASLKWTFFVLFIHNLRPSNRFCCLSLFKASIVWKILMTFSKQQQQVSFFLNLFSQACQTSTIGSHLSQTAFPDNQFWLRTPVMRFPGNSNKIHNFST